MRKLLLVGFLVTILFILNGCNHVNRGDVDKAILFQNGEVVFTFEEEKHADEIRVLVQSVNKVRSQTGMMDMPRSDYQLEFVLDNGKNVDYSLWIFTDSSSILENSISKYAELSSTDTEKLRKVVTEFDTSGIKHVNYYYLVMIIPVVIVIPILVDIVGRRRRAR